MDRELIRRRKARRLMAWTAMISMLITTLLIFFVVPESRLSLTDNVSTWFYTIMGSIVLAYTGAATWFDIKNISKTKKEETE